MAMSRFIEVQPQLQELPMELVVGVGDVLKFSATGGRVRSDAAVELLGILTDSVLGTDGRALTPAGRPNCVLFRATAPGSATIDVSTADPWRSTATSSFLVRVERSPTSATRI